jgi:alkylation response protein AidB-like acyl-CoA dehydrogenase
MVNFFNENEDIRFHLEHMDLSEIIRLKEKGFREREGFDYAPVDEADALDNYRQVLSLLGELAGDRIAARAAQVDKEGTKLEHGKVIYAKGIEMAIKELAQADLMGITLPRKYGGLNFPAPIYSMAIEIVSRADASLMTVFGLQDISETINAYADEEIKRKYLPKFSSGEVTGAMVLTEPDAGSDLQAVMLRATEDKDNGIWRLNGVKRFISNGCGHVLLVLARSEEGTRDARGLSLFLCESGEGVRIRRIEDKLGIKGSPTCEIQFTNTPAILIGRRKMGLIRYVMSLMNGARLGIAGQAVGIAEASFQAAKEYAESREQFGKKIRDFAAVRDLLVKMKVTLEAMRALTYETARVVELDHLLEEWITSGEIEDKEELKKQKERQARYKRWASMLTPMAKYYTTEEVQRIASDAIQVHGGSGYMKDYDVERHFRDARITNIYEGTSQLQVVAAIGGIRSGQFHSYVEDLFDRVREVAPQEKIEELRQRMVSAGACVDYLKGQSQAYQDLHAEEMVELAILLICSLLLLESAQHGDHKRVVAEKFLADALPEIDRLAVSIQSGDAFAVEQFEEIIGK